MIQDKSQTVALSERSARPMICRTAKVASRPSSTRLRPPSTRVPSQRAAKKPAATAPPAAQTESVSASSPMRMRGTNFAMITSSAISVKSSTAT